MLLDPRRSEKMFLAASDTRKYDNA